MTSELNIVIIKKNKRKERKMKKTRSENIKWGTKERGKTKRRRKRSKHKKNV